MIINLNKDELLKNLDFNVRAIKAKVQTTLPGLNAIKIIVKKNTMVLITESGNYSIKTVLTLPEESEDLEITVCGSDFYNVVKALREKTIKMEIKKEKMYFSCRKQKYNLEFKMGVTLDSEFNEDGAEFKTNNFVKNLENILFCLGKDKQVPIIGCVWFDENYLLGGDSARFSTFKIDVPIKGVAIPAKILEEISNILSSLENPIIKYKKVVNDKSVENIQFNINDKYYITGSLLADLYPTEAANSVKVTDKKVYCSGADFFNVISDFYLLLENKTGESLQMTISAKKIKVSMSTKSCSGEDEIEVKKAANIAEDEDIVTYFNCKYLYDIANKVKDKEEICINSFGQDSPISISTDNDAFIHSICNMGEMGD